MRKIVTGRRLAIRVDADTLLSVPPMRPDIPSDARVRILEAVLVRNVGLADTLIRIETDILEGRERKAGAYGLRLDANPYTAELNEAA